MANIQALVLWHVSMWRGEGAQQRLDDSSNLLIKHGRHQILRSLVVGGKVILNVKLWLIPQEMDGTLLFQIFQFHNKYTILFYFSCWKWALVYLTSPHFKHFNILKGPKLLDIIFSSSNRRERLTFIVHVVWGVIKSLQLLAVFLTISIHSIDVTITTQYSIHHSHNWNSPPHIQY